MCFSIESRSVNILFLSISPIKIKIISSYKLVTEIFELKILFNKITLKEIKKFNFSLINFEEKLR